MISYIHLSIQPFTIPLLYGVRAARLVKVDDTYTAYIYLYLLLRYVFDFSFIGPSICSLATVERPRTSFFTPVTLILLYFRCPIAFNVGDRASQRPQIRCPRSPDA